MTTARKLFRLLSPSKRRASTTLLGLMLIGMVMETLGISLVFPADVDDRDRSGGSLPRPVALAG